MAHNAPSEKTWRPFPELIPTELVNALNESGFNMREEDVSRPTQSSILQIFDYFYRMLAGQKLTDPSDDIILFYHQVQKMMDNAFVSDFSMKDWFKPTSQRIIIIVSGLVNFARFRSERLESIQDLIRNIADKSEKLKSTINFTQEQEQVAEVYHRQYESQLEITRPLEDEIDSLEETAAAMEEELNELKEKLKEKQADFDRLGDELATLQLSTYEEKIQLEGYRAQTVANVDELFNEKRILEREVEQLRRRFHEVGAKRQEKSRYPSILMSVLDELDIATGHLEECRLLSDKCCAVLQEIHAQRYKFTDTQREKMSKARDLEELKVKEVTEEERIQKQINLQTQRRKEYEDALTKFGNEYDRLLDVRKKLEDQKQIAKQQSKEILEIISQSKKCSEERARNLQREYSKLVAKISNYCQVLIEQFKNTANRISDNK